MPPVIGSGTPQSGFDISLIAWQLKRGADETWKTLIINAAILRRGPFLVSPLPGGEGRDVAKRSCVNVSPSNRSRDDLAMIRDD